MPPLPRHPSTRYLPSVFPIIRGRASAQSEPPPAAGNPHDCASAHTNTRRAGAVRTRFRNLNDALRTAARGDANGRPLERFESGYRLRLTSAPDPFVVDGDG